MMQGLLSNPVISGLLSGGPNAVRARSQQQVAQMLPRAGGGMMGAPSPIVQSGGGMGAGLAGLGEGLQKFAQVRKEQAAQEQAKSSLEKVLGLQSGGEAIAENVSMGGQPGPTQAAAQRQDPNPMKLPAGIVQAARMAYDAGDYTGGINLIQKGLTASPGARRIIKGADGKDYYEDTKEPVLPGVEAPAKPQETREINQGDNVVTQEWDGTKWATVARAPRFQPRAATPERYNLYKNGKEQEVGVGTKTEQVLLNAGWSHDPVAERKPPKVLETATGIYELTPDGLGRKIADAPAEPQDDLAADRLRDIKEGKVSQAINAYEDLGKTIRQAMTVLNHPGREAGTGMSSWRTMVPGSDAKGFASQLETLKSQVFLPEVKKMQGMGALSNAEGQKISAAFASLDTDMPEEEFKRSLETAIGDLRRAQERARLKLPGDYTDPFAASGGEGGADALNILIDKYAGEQ
jgi:hypothetical protein